MTTREMIDLIRQGTSPIGRKALLEMAKRLELLELILDGTQSLLWATERKLILVVKFRLIDLSSGCSWK